MQGGLSRLNPGNPLVQVAGIQEWEGAGRLTFKVPFMSIISAKSQQ